MPAFRPFVLALSALLTACSSLPTGPTDEALSLAQHRAQWERAHIGHYRFTILRICECTPEETLPIVVEVVGGEVQHRTYAASGSPVSVQIAPIFPTIPGLFDVIQDALDRRADGLAVRYDGDYGFPLSIQIDYLTGVADDELTYRIFEFEILP